MNFAPSYVAALVGILAAIFPEVEVDALNTTFNTLFIIGSSILVMVRQVQNGRSTLQGTRPE